MAASDHSQGVKSPGDKLGVWMPPDVGVGRSLLKDGAHDLWDLMLPVGGWGQQGLELQGPAGAGLAQGQWGRAPVTCYSPPPASAPSPCRLWVHTLHT